MEKELANVKYSVLMTVYYKENTEFLKYSIGCMLNQTIKPDEFVLVEDGELTEELYKTIDDFTKEYPNLFNIQKLEKNMGSGISSKVGVENCRNELIARMDSDDYSVPDRIEKELRILLNNPDLGLIGSNVDEFQDNIDNVCCHVILPEKHEEIYKFSKKRCPFRTPAIIFKKSEVLRAGNYRNCYLHEDYDLYIRMIQNGTKCYNIQEALAFVRVNSDFYKRRGGWKYLKSIVRFKTNQLKSGYFSLWDYLVSIIPHIIVCLIPNKLRDYIYRNFLRKREK